MSGETKGPAAYSVVDASHDSQRLQDYYTVGPDGGYLRGFMNEIDAIDLSDLLNAAFAAGRAAGLKEAAQVIREIADEDRAACCPCTESDQEAASVYRMADALAARAKEGKP